MDGTIHNGSLQSYGGEGFAAERLKRHVGVKALIAAIRARRSVPPNGKFVRQKLVREGVANEETGFLRDKQTLVLVQCMFQPTQNRRNLNISCQKRAGPRRAAGTRQARDPRPR